MSTVLVTYDQSDVVVATGRTPVNPTTPIANPVDCGLVTNQRLPFATGAHCFTLLSGDTFLPLWISLDLGVGQDATINFKRTPD
jgi:hypothetical protein